MRSSLGELLQDYSHIELGTEEDNDSILAFLSQIPMEGKELSLRYDRNPDFFALLKEQGDHAYIFKMLNKDKSLGGIGVISVRKAWVGGKPSYVAYTSDLRVSPKLWSRTKVQWRKCYEAIIKDYLDLEEFSQVSFIYTAVFDDNAAALSALASGKSGFIYEAICPYQSMNIYARLPFLAKSQDQYHVEIISEEKALKSFLQTNNEKLCGGHFYHTQEATDEWTRRAQASKHYHYSEYLAIKDQQGQLLSCCYPWLKGPSRTIYVEKMNLFLRLLGKVLPLFGRLKMAEGLGLHILYLCDLTFTSSLTQEEQVQHIIAYLHYIKEQDIDKDHHLINVLDFYNPQLPAALKKQGYLFEPKQATLYQVKHPSHANDERYQDLPSLSSMGLELALS